MDLRPIFRKSIKIDKSEELPYDEIEATLAVMASQVGATTEKFLATLDWYANRLELGFTVSSKNLEDKLIGKKITILDI